MGQTQHRIMVITASNFDDAATATIKAMELFKNTMCKLAQIEEAVNGYHTFFIHPTGSERPWGDVGTAADTASQHFVDWLDQDDTPNYDWAWVQYGNQHAQPRVLNGSHM